MAGRRIRLQLLHLSKKLIFRYFTYQRTGCWAHLLSKLNRPANSFQSRQTSTYSSLTLNRESQGRVVILDIFFADADDTFARIPSVDSDMEVASSQLSCKKSVTKPRERVGMSGSFMDIRMNGQVLGWHLFLFLGRRRFYLCGMHDASEWVEQSAAIRWIASELLGIRFSVASFQDNLVELRIWIVRLFGSVNRAPFASLYIHITGFTGKSGRLVRPMFFTTRYGVKTFGFRLLLQLKLVNSANQPWNDKLLDIGLTQLEICLKRQSTRHFSRGAQSKSVFFPLCPAQTDNTWCCPKENCASCPSARGTRITSTTAESSSNRPARLWPSSDGQLKYLRFINNRLILIGNLYQ